MYLGIHEVWPAIICGTESGVATPPVWPHQTSVAPWHIAAKEAATLEYRRRDVTVLDDVIMMSLSFSSSGRVNIGVESLALTKVWSHIIYTKFQI